MNVNAAHLTRVSQGTKRPRVPRVPHPSRDICENGEAYSRLSDGLAPVLSWIMEQVREA